MVTEQPPGVPVVALVMCLDGVMVRMVMGGDVPTRCYWSIPRDAIAYVAKDWVGQKKPAVCADPCRPPVIISSVLSWLSSYFPCLRKLTVLSSEASHVRNLHGSIMGVWPEAVIF